MPDVSRLREQTLSRTRSFLAHSWPLDMCPEVEACEREVEAVLDTLREKNEIIKAYAGPTGLTPEDIASAREAIGEYFAAEAAYDMGLVDAEVIGEARAALRSALS